MGAGRPWDPCLQGHRAQLHPLPSQGELTPHPAPPTSKGTGQRCGQQGPRAGAGHRQTGTCTPHPTAGEEPAERPPNLGNLAALQETGNMGDVSWRGKYTKLLGDQGVKRMDAQDFLWLLNDPPPPMRAGAKLFPVGGRRPSPLHSAPAQPPTSSPACWEVGREQQEGAQEPNAAPTSLGAKGCEASAAPPL